MVKITKRMADKAYEEGNPLISDSEYDSLFGVNATSEYIDSKSFWPKVKHKDALGGASLSKIVVSGNDNTKFDFSDLKAWVTSTKAKYFIMMWKYDGNSISLYYDNGDLVHALTKGKNGIGEDILANVLKMKNVKPTIPGFTGIIKAEAIMHLSDFERLPLDQDGNKPMKNARNGTTGAAKSHDGQYAKYVTLHYCNVVEWPNRTWLDFDNHLEKLKWLRVNFKHVEYPMKLQTVEECIEEYKNRLEIRADLDFEVDGVALYVNSRKKQESLGHQASGNPKFICAVKFPYDKKETSLKNIEWSLGLTGTINPVAIMKEVDLAGVTVRRASLANLDEINRLWDGKTPKVGDTILISRRNDVIPKVEQVMTRNKDGSKLLPPKECPICIHETFIEGPFLMCTNETCQSRVLGNLNKWLGKIKEHFGVTGISTETVFKLSEASLVSEPADLYKLTSKQLISNLDGIKEKSANNILDFQRHTKMPLSIFLSGLNISKLSEGIFDFVVDEGYNTLDKVLALTVSDLVSIKNISEVRAKLIVTGLKKKKSVIKNLLDVGITIEKPKKKAVGVLTGKSFCFTGSLSSPRPHFEGLVLDAGGTIKGVSGNLDYLVMGENAGSKQAKAEKLGIKIINEQQFLKLLDA